MDAGKVSAGFLIKSDGLYLLAHCTQRKDDKNIRQFDGQWTVIKGEVDAGESLLQAALRELKEEASLDLAAAFPTLMPADSTLPKYKYKTGRGKVVHIFELDDREGLIRNAGLVFTCTSLLGSDLPPKLAHRAGAPEVDAFMWVRKDEAERMVFPSQKDIFK